MAALLLSAHPTLTPTNIRTNLVNGTVDINTPGYDLRTGYGLIDAVGAFLTLTNGDLALDGDQDYAGENDTFLLRMDANDNTLLDIILNGTMLGSVHLSTVQQINISGLGGNDTLIIDSSNGLIMDPNGIFFDGGTGFNKLNFIQTGGTQTSDTYTRVGPNVGDARDTIVGPGGTQTVYANNIAPVLDTVPAATLIVNGTTADNAINYTAGSVVANGMVTIDNFESMEFSNRPTYQLNGLAGNDAINLNNSNTPTGLTTITVNGGDPTASGSNSGDVLIVNGTAAQQGHRRARWLPTGPSSPGLSRFP